MRWKAPLVVLIALAAPGFIGGWIASAPRPLSDGEVAHTAGDAARGARVFHVGGCASCHAAKGAKGDDRLKLAGGGALATPFGRFQPPNISPGPDGIGGWSLAQFDNAMRRGISPDGRHYYPAFPYTSYARMTAADVADLFAYLKTLPAIAGKAPASAVSFPYNIRRGIGLWKLAYLDPRPVVTLPAGAAAEVKRGQYLVEGPGHCGECHTPRTRLGGTDRSRWLAGAPDPEGKGKVPRLAGIRWSAAEIAEYLKTGFTPDYDSVGGSMVEVQTNLAALPDADRAAIAAYLKAVPAVKP
ncbi:MAG: cytochrome c [Sphingomonadales bacterium]|jgi:mono/diheme cytochrome c family protein